MNKYELYLSEIDFSDETVFFIKKKNNLDQNTIKILDSILGDSFINNGWYLNTKEELAKINENNITISYNNLVIMDKH